MCCVGSSNPLPPSLGGFDFEIIMCFRGRRGHVTTSSVSFASLLTDSGTITNFSSVDDPDPGSVQFDTRIRDKILWIVHLRAWISTSQNVYLSFSYRFTLFTTGLSTCIFTFTSKAHYIVRST